MTYLKLGVLSALSTALLIGLGESAKAASLYSQDSQTLPVVLSRPDAKTITFTDTPIPTSLVTLTATGIGDIDGSGISGPEFVEVYAEDNETFLGILFNEIDDKYYVPKTDSILFSLSDTLKNFFSDGITNFIFRVDAQSGISQVTISSATLTYEYETDAAELTPVYATNVAEATPVPEPTSILGMSMALGLAGLLRRANQKCEV